MADQTAYKPGSVPPGVRANPGARCGDHSSGPALAGRFSRPTRTPQANDGPTGLRRRGIPIRSCSWRGLPCRRRRRQRGALLPHPFTLTPQREAVCFLWRYPWGRPRRALPAAMSSWSPDCPRPPKRPRPPSRLIRRDQWAQGPLRSRVSVRGARSHGAGHGVIAKRDCDPSAHLGGLVLRELEGRLQPVGPQPKARRGAQQRRPRTDRRSGGR